MTISQIGPDETSVQSYPLWDGIHDKGLDLEAIQAGENHNPNDRDHAHHSSRQQGDHRPEDNHQLLYDAPGDQETMTETMSHRTADTSPSCPQCHHDRRKKNHTTPRRDVATRL
jgi:hypothetical protein